MKDRDISEISIPGRNCFICSERYPNSHVRFYFFYFYFLLLCYFKNGIMQKKYLFVSSQAWPKLLTPLRRLIMQYRLNSLWSRTAKLACLFTQECSVFKGFSTCVESAGERETACREGKVTFWQLYRLILSSFPSRQLLLLSVLNRISSTIFSHGFLLYYVVCHIYRH